MVYMMAKVRVLRIIEYTYDTQKIAENDMGRWNVPANGTYKRAEGRIIKSATIMDLNFKDDEDGN